jgi:hypothetical protein
MCVCMYAFIFTYTQTYIHNREKLTSGDASLSNFGAGAFCPELLAPIVGEIMGPIPHMFIGKAPPIGIGETARYPGLVKVKLLLGNPVKLPPWLTRTLRGDVAVGNALGTTVVAGVGDLAGGGGDLSRGGDCCVRGDA